jgi:hypothetical protein
VFGTRRPKPPSTSHAALRTGARSLPRRVPRPKPKETAQQLPDGCPKKCRRCSASPAETRETVAHPRPNGCPIASGVSPDPAETGARSTIAAFRRGARLPKVRHHPRPKPRKDLQQLRPDGCPVAEGASPSEAEAKERSTTAAPRRVPGCRSRFTQFGRNRREIHNSCAQTGARLPKPLHPIRPKPKRGPQQLRPRGVPSCRRCITQFGRNRNRVRNSCARTVPDYRSRFTPRGRNREEIHNSSARTGARLPKPLHPPRPKPRRDPQQQRSDGCPNVEGTSPSPAEAKERSASTTLGRVPVCRRYVAPGGRSHRETPQHPCPNECPFADVTSPPRPKPKRHRHINARTGARVSTEHHPLQPKPKRALNKPAARLRVRQPTSRHPLQPKPKKTPQHRRQDVSACRPHVTPSSRNRRRLRNIDARTVLVCRWNIAPSSRNRRRLRNINARTVPVCRRNIAPSSRSQRELR